MGKKGLATSLTPGQGVEVKVNTMKEMTACCLRQALTGEENWMINIQFSGREKRALVLNELLLIHFSCRLLHISLAVFSDLKKKREIVRKNCAKLLLQ